MRARDPVAASTRVPVHARTVRAGFSRSASGLSSLSTHTAHDLRDHRTRRTVNVERARTRVADYPAPMRRRHDNAQPRLVNKQPNAKLWLKNDLPRTAMKADSAVAPWTSRGLSACKDHHRQRRAIRYASGPMMSRTPLRRNGCANWAKKPAAMRPWIPMSAGGRRAGLQYVPNNRSHSTRFSP